MAVETIGFVGTGRMGGPMAGRLLDAGYSLCVYDSQSEATKALVARGARLAKSPAEVASSADIVLASLPTPDIVKAVALGPDGIVAGNRATVLLDIINASSGRNSASEDKFPRALLPATFDFGFTTGLSYKDVRLCVDEAEAMGVPMVCGSVVRQMLAITNAKYGASSDFTSIAKVLEEWAGVEMRG